MNFAICGTDIYVSADMDQKRIIFITSMSIGTDHKITGIYIFSRYITSWGVKMVTDLDVHSITVVGNGEDNWLNGVAWGVDADLTCLPSTWAMARWWISRSP